MSENPKKEEIEVDVTETPVEKELSEVVSKELKKDETKKGIKLPMLKNAKGVGKTVPIGPGNFWNNILSTVLLLVFITAAYSYVVERQVKTEEFAVSEIAQQVKKGEVSKIVVRGAELEVEYTDTTKTKGTAKKERDAAVTETLVALGVTTDQLNAVKIDVQNEIETSIQKNGSICVADAIHINCCNSTTANKIQCKRECDHWL